MKTRKNFLQAAALSCLMTLTAVSFGQNQPVGPTGHSPQCRDCAKVAKQGWGPILPRTSLKKAKPAQQTSRPAQRRTGRSR